MVLMVALNRSSTSGQPLNISTQVMMNNLVSVDEITDAVTFDIFLTLQWVDCRFVTGCDCVLHRSFYFIVDF